MQCGVRCEVSTALASSAATLSHVQSITLHQGGRGKRGARISVPLFNSFVSCRRPHRNRKTDDRKHCWHQPSFVYCCVPVLSRGGGGGEWGAHNGSVSANMCNKCICLHVRAEQLQLFTCTGLFLYLQGWQRHNLWEHIFSLNDRSMKDTGTESWKCVLSGSVCLAALNYL